MLNELAFAALITCYFYCNFTALWLENGGF